MQVCCLQPVWNTIYSWWSASTTVKQPWNQSSLRTCTLCQRRPRSWPWVVPTTSYRSGCSWTHQRDTPSPEQQRIQKYYSLGSGSKELDIFLTMKVLENTPAVLSLGKLCDENGYSYEWINGQKPHLIKNGIRIICNTENFVPIVVPGLSSSSSGFSSTSRTPMKQESHSSSSSSSSPSSPTVDEISVREREDAPNSDISPVPVSELVDDRSGKPEGIQANETQKTNKKETTIKRWNPCDVSEIPEWLKEFREILVDDEIPLQGGSHASSSHEASLEPITKRREDLGKHNVHTHFPKDRNCEICKRTKITRAPCRRRNGEAVPRAEKFVWLDNSRSQRPQWQLRVSKQSSIRSRGAGSSYSMDPGVSVQKQNFTKKPREACKSSWNPRGIQQSLTLTIPWNSAKLVKIFPGIIARLHHIDRRLMVLPKGQCAE